MNEYIDYYYEGRSVCVKCQIKFILLSKYHKIKSSAR